MKQWNNESNMSRPLESPATIARSRYLPPSLLRSCMGESAAEAGGSASRRAHMLSTIQWNSGMDLPVIVSHDKGTITTVWNFPSLSLQFGVIASGCVSP
jgi:hypothetical protein